MAERKTPGAVPDHRPARGGDRARAERAFQEATAHHLAGRGAEAEAGYRAALAADPAHAEAHNNLGVLLRVRDPGAGARHFREAVRLLPRYGDAWVNLGRALHREGRLRDARDAFATAARVCPDLAPAHHFLGIAEYELGDPEAAARALFVAARLSPNDPAPLSNLGNARMAQRRFDEAEALYRRALEISPDYVEALNNLGGVCRSLRRNSEAVELFERALAIRPDYLDALRNLALTCALDAQSAGRSLATFRAAVERNGGAPPYRAVLALALQELGHPAEAREQALLTLRDDPEQIDAHVILATGAAGENRYEEAIGHCERILALNPGDAPARWNRGFARLALGDYARGWEDYEARWELTHMVVDHRELPGPPWGGESLDGRTILLYTEQGLGDGIQFVRFARALKERWSVRVVVEAQPSLVPLFRTCRYVDEVIRRGERRPVFDVHAPLLSLPRLLGVTLESLRGEAYLEAPSRPVAARVRPSPRLKVGLVWGGGTPTPTLALRSLTLEGLRPLLDLDSVDFYSLQKPPHDAQLGAAGLAGRVVDLAPELDDFTDTAAAIAALDLVVTIDTSVAHLAGALGKPVWILLIHGADWRWLVDRRDSPWYASARLYRQPPAGGWEPVVSAVRDDLAALAGAAPREPSDAGPEPRTLHVPSVQRDTRGRPRFTIAVPAAELRTPAELERIGAELTAGGVDAELRHFLDEELRDGDAYLDLGAGWGFAALSAATTPGRSVTALAVVGADDDEVARDAARGNRLVGSLRVLGAGEAAERAVDELLPPSRVPDGRLFLRVSEGFDVAGAVAGAAGWMASGRLAAAVWSPLTPPEEEELHLRDQIVADALEALGFEHLRMTVDDEGPVLVPWRGAGAAGPVFSLSLAHFQDAAPERDDATPAAPRPAAPPLLGIDWQIGSNSGWGVYGFNLVRRALETGRALPALLTPPDLRPLSAGDRDRIAPALALHEEIARAAAGGRTVAGIPVLRALGNHLLGGPDTHRPAATDVGVVFFEDTRLDAGALARGRAYRSVVAGSSWNAEVLRAHGLTNVECCLQGIDPALLAPARRTGVHGDRFVVFSGGKLEYRKGQDLVVAAFREFHRRHPDALLLLAWHNHWARTMVEIGLRGHVRGVPRALPGGAIDFSGWLVANGLPAGSFVDLGELTHAEHARAMREAQVGLFPNRCEGGTNLVAMECMAAGIPAILSSNTGHLDLIREGNCYPLLDQRPAAPSASFAGTDGWGESSVEEIVDRLEAAYTDRDEAARRGAAGAATARLLTWDSRIDRLLDLLGDFPSSL